MKEIVVLDKTYQYKIKCRDSEFGLYFITKFYDGVDIIRYKKFWLFGKELKKAVPKFFFKVDYSIESTTITKQELKLNLEKEFSRQLGLKNRKLEIKNGELI
jgi:hypothetical protein